MSEHTRGPWFVKGRGERFWVWSEMGRICTMTPWSRDVETADAALIAAAPDLLTELQTSRCPRPTNTAPWDTTVAQCLARDECGCSAGGAVMKALGKLPVSKGVLEK